MTSPSLCDQALALHRVGRLAEAERLYLAAIAADPGDFNAPHLLGVMRFHQGRHDEALALIGAALTLNPYDPEALSNCGNVLKMLGRLDEALARYDAALALQPGLETFYNRGLALAQLGRFTEAVASYDAALALEPRLAVALDNRGIALRSLGRPLEALASFEAALALEPGNADALGNRGVVLRELERPAEALACFDAVLALAPGNVSALYNRGNVLRDLKRPEEAFLTYVKVLSLDPRHPHARDGAANAALHLCDWSRTTQIADLLKADIAVGRSVISPFTLLGYSDDAALQRQCAENFTRTIIPLRPAPLWNGEAYRHDKIRIAYLSADFKNHPTAHLMAGLFEAHDRSQFEISAISFGADDGSAMRARLIKAFDHFHDGRGQSDAELAHLLRRLEVDIAVDLNGHTGGSRPRILSHRPAPLQVSYLGYPGTMGADFIDYVIADAMVVPFDQQPNFTEQIVHLPHSYQVNDAARSIADQTPSRRDLGLPEQGFVFCCFNNSWKITQPVFDVWMRLLAAVPGSVLWLIADNDGARLHLQGAAAARGIARDRLVFAPRQELAQHLARHRAADLFLDTRPVNAHTTASDALWAGLPLVTCAGACFAARVAASLLQACGLPELVTQSLQDYEALALKLARDPGLLASIREKLAAARTTAPLFDTRRFCGHLEAAYKRMWQTAQSGQAPRSFAVNIS